MNRRNFIKLPVLAAVASLPLLSVQAFAAKPIYKSWTGLAVGGYDTVAYFTMGKPVEGSSEFSVEHNGATWRFASAEHRDLFVANPEKYAPQYGGHCAYAMAKGSLASVVPEAWDIVDGRLFLNYSLGVQKLWRGDRDNFIVAADQEWPKF